MDRRTFALGMSALVAASSAARGQSPPPTDPAAAPTALTLPEAFVAEQQATGLPPSEFALSRKIELLRTIPGRLERANADEAAEFIDDLPVARSEWLYLDDGGAFAVLFGDTVSDETLVGLVGAMVETGDTQSSAAMDFSGSLPPGFVAYQALTRYAYISGAAPADSGGRYGDYAVAFHAGDTAESLSTRLVASQQSWNDFIARHGAGAVNRL